MARRQIKDERGMAWDVWDVSPADAIGRPAHDRPSPANADDDALTTRPMLHAELEQGWVCFQCATERRRFAPIPIGWVDLPDGVLRVMLDIARPVPPSTDSILNPRQSAAE